MTATTQRSYSFGEEILHAGSHGIGLLLAVTAAFFLAFQVADSTNALALAAALIYALSMAFLYAASTLYHSAPGSRFHSFYKLLDHSAIFIKIAGSYTPFALLAMPVERGVPFTALIWAIALLGIGFKIWKFAAGAQHRFGRISLAFYLGMGWLAIFTLGDIVEAVPIEGIYWLVAGGLSYTFGSVFYAIKSIPLGHFIWHLFVMAGSACHFFSVYWYLL